MPNNYKLVALDMDGTTYYSMGPVVESNVKPIISAQEQGTKVVFVTGRPLKAPMNQFVENGFTKHEAIVICYNGALVYDFHNNQEVDRHPIDKQTVKQAFLKTLEIDNNHDVIWGYSTDENKIFLSGSIFGTPLQEELNFFDGEIVNINKDNIDELTDCFKLLVTKWTDAFLDWMSDNGFEVACSPTSVTAEVNKKGISKRVGLEFLCQKYDIKPEEMLAVGDGKNDIAMLKYVGYSLAPRNANPMVKEVVDEVLDYSCDEGAVAYLLKKYILKGE